MFAKPFKIKTQTVIRSSDRKKIRNDVSQAFPGIREEGLAALFPNKEEMTSMKIYSHSGENVIVYCLKKNPIFFQLDKTIYPTVYTLWQHSDLLQAFSTLPAVVPKLINGADLMLPGVVTGGPVTPDTFKHVHKGDRCLINTVDNRAPVAVGIVSMEGTDFYDSGMRGRGIRVIHVYKDELWAHGDKSTLPRLGPVFSSTLDDDVTASDHLTPSSANENSTDFAFPASKNESETIVESLDKVDLSADVSNLKSGSQNEATTTGGQLSENEVQNGAGQSEQFVETIESMDELLYQCLLCSLKADVTSEELPLLTSKLLRAYMVPWCPIGRSLDLKKSSYKKLSKFLSSMETEKLVAVKELSKGVQSIIDVNREHRRLCRYKLPERPVHAVDPSEESGTGYQPPRLDELYAVSGATIPIFTAAGCAKGEALESIKVRQVMKEYVKKNNLIAENNPKMVTLDGLLSDAILNKGERDVTHVTWEQLFTRCMEKMSPVLRITYSGQEPKLLKGKLQPIHLSVVQRSGNKKVTLIDNLDQFGIDTAAFAHELQLAVAGSTTVQPIPNRKQGLQVTVQGNQVHFVADLLLGKYGLNKKYITGVDKAPKPRNAKKR